ncbi:MAG: glycosyltransferase family 2 protein [Hyphomicrobiaceae bacterium]
MDCGDRPEVSILIVSYNTRKLTLAALDSVVRETAVAHEIIVVDNASTDGSAAAIAAHPSKPRLIALDENIGFGPANNLAARKARADHILLLNPDTVVLYHAIDRLLEFAHQHPQAMIWGGRTLFPDGTLNPSSCWQRITLWNQFCRTSGLTGLFPDSPRFNGEAMAGWARDTVREVDIVSGCFLMLRRAFWRDLGGFDPAFFMYGEEADLCLRARRLGAQPMVTPHATIIHLGGASEATRAGKMIKLLAAKVSLVDRHMHGIERITTRAVLRLWPLTRLIAMSVAARVKGREDYARSAAAWRDVWKARPTWRHGYAAATGEAAGSTYGRPQALPQH